MKRILLTMLACASMHLASAQETHPALQKGKWMVETNLSPLSGLSTTGFSFISNDGQKAWSVGGEAGYFVTDKLALKAGLGFLGQSNDSDDTNTFSYKLGAKYYIVNVLPVQFDFGGLNQSGENAFIFGGQLGYAIFLKDNITLEPAVRYDHGLNDMASGVKAFSARVGFSLHF